MFHDGSQDNSCLNWRLSLWISCFCIGFIGECIVKYETGELLHSVAGSLQSRQAGTCATSASIETRARSGPETSIWKPDTRGGGLPPIPLGAPR